MGCVPSSRAEVAVEDPRQIQSAALDLDVNAELVCPPCDGGTGPSKLFTSGENLGDKLVGVVVTICEGNSYDEMFREVRPTTVPGERVSTYSLGTLEVHHLLAYLSAAAAAPEPWRELVEDVRAVAADAVVFNFECCSGCGDHAFPGGIRDGGGGRRHLSFAPQAAGSSPTMSFIGFAVRRGFTVMCSDFSLKSLLYEWSEEHLGPNPFMKVGECDVSFVLEFDPAELQHEEVPQQLQVVGELCADQGKAAVGALGGTIVYSVNPERKRTALYDIKVLTVVTQSSIGSNLREEQQCVAGSGSRAKRGAAGHVSLSYASGGQLITSCGHWIELTRINTSEDAVRRVAQKNFGCGKFQAFERDLSVLATDSERAACTQQWAKGMIQESMASRMKCRTKF